MRKISLLTQQTLSSMNLCNFIAKSYEWLPINEENFIIDSKRQFRVTLSFSLESTKYYLDISKVLSHSFIGAWQRIPFIPKRKSERREKDSSSHDAVKISVINGSVHWPVGNGQWWPTKQSIQRVLLGPSPAIISTVTYVHVVHVLTICRLLRELRLNKP